MSSVDILPGHERILSGCYDGFLRVWNSSSQVLATSPGAAQGGHQSSILSAKFVSHSQLASSGLDMTIRLWSYTEEDDTFSGTIKPQLQLYGPQGGHQVDISTRTFKSNTVCIGGPQRRVLVDKSIRRNRSSSDITPICRAWFEKEETKLGCPSAHRGDS